MDAKKAGVSPGQRKEHKWQYVLPDEISILFQLNQSNNVPMAT
jgi:hypothetical protein